MCAVRWSFVTPKAGRATPGGVTYGAAPLHAVAGPYSKCEQNGMARQVTAQTPRPCAVRMGVTALVRLSSLCGESFFRRAVCFFVFLGCRISDLTQRILGEL